MDKSAVDKMLKMAVSENDTDALMGLRGLQGGFKSDGIPFTDAVMFAFDNLQLLKDRAAKTQVVESSAPKSAAPVTMSGMPQCRVAKAGNIELIAPNKDSGLLVPLPGAAAEQAEGIALALKDALVAAVINKSRFKLKVFDIKNNRGEIVETALQAEYERAGMAVVRVWVNVKGEVAALANVLRKSIATVFPELWIV